MAPHVLDAEVETGKRGVTQGVLDAPEHFPLKASSLCGIRLQQSAIMHAALRIEDVSDIAGIVRPITTDSIAQTLFEMRCFRAEKAVPWSTCCRVLLQSSCTRRCSSPQPCVHTRRSEQLRSCDPHVDEDLKCAKVLVHV